MKFKISIIILILLSFLNIGAISDKHFKINSFDDLESLYIDKSNFVENGSKIQYKTKNLIKDESNKIQQYINKDNIYKYEYIEKNKMRFLGENRCIETELWNDDIYTYVVITVVNNNKDYKTEDLLRTLEKLIRSDCEEVQYFRYYKGQISCDHENEYINDISSCISEYKTLKMSNGYIGSGYFNDGEKINLAISNYNTGTYIIIGTPIIFTTY